MLLWRRENSHTRKQVNFMNIGSRPLIASEIRNKKIRKKKVVETLTKVTDSTKASVTFALPDKAVFSLTLLTPWLPYNRLKFYRPFR